MKPFQYLSPIYDFEYIRPKDLGDALRIMSRSRVKPIAGGTDLSVALKDGYRINALLDLSALRSEMAYIREDGHEIKIGSLTTYDEIYRSPTINAQATCLSEAAYNIGTWQIRNLATIGGNLANASPAADGATALMALGASVRVVSAEAERIIPVHQVFVGPKKSSLNENELITEISFKKAEELRSGWARIGRRNANTISVVNAAVAAHLVDKTFKSVKIALGSVAPTPIYAGEAAKFLVGKRADEKVISKAADLAQDAASPITDTRGTKDYRLKMVRFLTEKLLIRISGGA